MSKRSALSPDLPSTDPTQGRRLLLNYGLVAWWISRLLYSGARELVPDEAYYWVWSRHLAPGYLDHPPIVAWAIYLGTRVLGNTEAGVRLPASIFTLGTILITLQIARRTAPMPRAWLLCGLVLLLSPLVAALGTIITPDTPACFFSIACLALAVNIFSNEAESAPAIARWLAFGVCFGLALDSKYTSVLVGVAIAAAMLSTPPGRRELARPWPWLAALVALAVFAPVIYWNYQHHWRSFAFQLHHGSAEDAGAPIANLGNYLGGQAFVWTPVLFVVWMIAMAWYWRRFSSLSTIDRMLLFASTLPLVFFAVSSLRHKPEANWPAFAYFPMTILATRWIAQPISWRMKWTSIGLWVSAIGLFVVHLPELIRPIPVKYLKTIPSRWDDLFGWQQVGQALDARTLGGGVVFCTSYEYAAEAQFYMAGHPDAWTIDTDRPTAFDDFARPPDIASLPKVVCVRRIPSEDARGATTAPATRERLPTGFELFGLITIEHWETNALGRPIRRREFITASERLDTPDKPAAPGKSEQIPTTSP